MSDVLLVERRDQVALLTLNRPEVRNALNTALNDAIVEAVRACEADPEVRAMVLTGADPAFCAGADLKEWTSMPVDFPDRPRRPFRGNLGPHDKLLIGAINGPTATGGLELALNCDFLVASEKAAFADTHARVGVMPGAGDTVLLAERIGLARAKQMSLTALFIDAKTALSWGLVNAVVPHEGLVEHALKLAGECAAIDPGAAQAMHRIYDQIADATLGESWAIEERARNEWARSGYDRSKMDSRRNEVVKRGRGQVGRDAPS